jgi:hypothetical protein
MDDAKEWEERTGRRLRTRLQRDVPPAIRAYLRQGGPSDEDYARIRGYATAIGAFGDVILYPDGKGSEEPHLEKLVDGVAVLSFCPGGVHLYGLDFEAAKIEQDPRQDELHELIAYFDRILDL